MVTQSINLGKRIRKLRVQQHRTLQDVADECGFTKSLLSKIETGKVVPPVATLVKIAQTMGIRVSTLIENNDDAETVYTTKKETEENFTRTRVGYSIFPFATNHINKKMQPFLFVARRGEVKEHRVTHVGEEFLYVIEGEMKFKVGNIEYTLKAGDGLYFSALDEHGVMPISEEVRYLDVFV
jgi:transcriptional regulator with XRE-family HTH domain